MLTLIIALLAQAPDVAAPQESTRLQALDKALAADDHPQLSRLFLSTETADVAKESLDWGRSRWLMGNSAIVPFLYSRLLWGIAEGDPSGQAEADGIKLTAAAAMLYVVGIAPIDGARCGDRSAPADRRVKLIQAGRDVWRFLGTTTAEDRRTVVTVAVDIERKTAAMRDARGDPEFYCRFGLEETTYNLRHGSAKERPARPGEFGRQIELTGDGKFKPSIRDEKDWRPEAAAARAKLEAELTGFVEALAKRGQ